DPTPVVWVVDHGREEVGGDHKRPLIIEAPHRSVVARVRTHQQLAAPARRQRLDDAGEVRGIELAGTPCAVTELREPPGGHRLASISVPIDQRWRLAGGPMWATFAMTE